MRLSYTLAAIVGSIWLLLALSGLSAVRHAKLHHLPVDIVAGRASYYLHFPLAVLAFIVGALIITRYEPVRFLAYVIYAFAMLALPFYLFFYTGGM